MPLLSTSFSAGHGKADGRRGFTIIELSVVLLLVSLLAALFLPAYQSALMRIRTGALINNLHKTAQGLLLLAGDSGDRLPATTNPPSGNGTSNTEWQQLVKPYLGDGSEHI